MKKKSTLAALLMAAMLSGNPFNANAQNYDFSKVDWTKMVEVFATALENGKQYPTDQEIMAIGISRADLEFMRSHVKQRTRVDNNNRLISDTYAGRKLWMNTPMGSGSGGDAGYPTGSFHSDVFSLWNYTAMWGSWNHSIGQVPGSWTDAAHKNGCDMLGGTVFFDASHGDWGAYYTWNKYSNEKSNNANVAYKSFKYVKPLVNMLRYFGVDGININWEAGSPVESMQFHKACYAYAKESGFNNFHIGLYTTSSSLSNANVDANYADRDEQTCDAMLNYGGENSLGNSQSVAKQHNPTLGASGVWQGFWIVGLDKDWGALSEDDSKEVNICLWGEHKDSRFWSYNSGAGAMNQQANYQAFLERAFSGGKRNPLSRPEVSDRGNKMEWSGTTPPLSTFAGFATWIPERSTVQGKFPFATNFNLGNGDRYNYRGKMVSGAWYNMSAQDVVPTYRWLVVNEGQMTPSEALTVNFSHEDAFNGGSCLQLKGDASKAPDVILYKTDITPNDAATYALVSTKGAGDRTEGAVESHLYLIVKVNGTWKEYKVPDNTGKSWQEHRIALNLGTADKITEVGLRVKGGDANYNMYVGSLELNDGNKVNPTAIKDLVVAKTAETPSTMDLKLDWSVNANANNYGLVYNDDANIDHFEILFKDGADGKVVEVGRTSQWATFIPALDVKTSTQPYIGVVAVSKDLKSHSEILWKALEKNANAEEDPFGTYGQSSLDKNGEGWKTALKLRGVERFKTTGAEENIDFQQSYEQFKNSNKDNKYLNYHHVKGMTLKVRQGQVIDFRLKGFNGETLNLGKDDCRYCFVGGWMDFDGSGTFNYGKGMEEQPFWLPLYDNTIQGEADYAFDEKTKDGTEPYGERVFRHGSLRKGNLTLVKGEGLKGQIKIPTDAHVGKSRLRIVYSDAWFPGQFTPTANNNKGYTLDIDVEIVGNEAGQRGPKDLHDKGETENWNVVTEITEVAADNTGSVQVVNGNLVFKGVQSATIYTVDGMLVRNLTKPTVVRGNELGRGVYLVKTGANKTTKVIL